MACDFLNEVSQRLMGDDEARRYPDVITFAFFCRRASLQAMKKDYEGKLGGRLGRGVTFHIAPSNVPINFAYSLVAGLLAGNRCIVRASSKDFPQTGIVCRALKAAAGTGGFKEMEDIISVVTYGHEAGITDALSAFADVRVIWGGDTTVAEIRKSPLAPRAFDVTFADRYSLAVISAGYVLAQDAASMGRIAQGFYNDTYLYDQNACSSPPPASSCGWERRTCAPLQRRSSGPPSMNISRKDTSSPRYSPWTSSPRRTGARWSLTGCGWRNPATTW